MRWQWRRSAEDLWTGTAGSEQFRLEASSQQARVVLRNVVVAQADTPSGMSVPGRVHWAIRRSEALAEAFVLETLGLSDA